MLPRHHAKYLLVNTFYSKSGGPVTKIALYNYCNEFRCMDELVFFIAWLTFYTYFSTNWHNLCKMCLRVIEASNPVIAFYCLCLKLWGQRDWSAMLATKRSAGFHSEENLRNSSHASDKACKWRIHFGVETQNRSILPPKLLRSPNCFLKHIFW